MWFRPRDDTLVCFQPEHVQGGAGKLHLRGLEERLPDHLHAGCQQRARGGRPGGPDAQHALGEWPAGQRGAQAAPPPVSVG